MLINISYSNKLVVFDFTLEDADRELLKNPVNINNRSCFFELPFEIKEKIHPDVLAMAIILMIFPFTKYNIKLPFSISKEFAEVFMNNFEIQIGPVDNSILPRKVQNGRPGLSYSGGVDSTAALALMPKNTAIIFLNRIIPSYKNSLYDKTAALNTLKDVSNTYQTYKVNTNMEYIRNPIGFPISNFGKRGDIPLSSAVPIVLLADKLNIDSIAYGIVMESLYLVGHEKFDDFSQNKIFINWKKLFNKIGIDLFFPTAGLSEVSTSKISNNFSISKYVRSCMRGKKDEPCKKCIKCFRKLTLDKALLKEGVNSKELMNNLQNNEVVRNLYSNIKHENVYRYIVEQLKPNDFTLALGKRINIDNENTLWMERWYHKSINLVPIKYQKQYQENLHNYINDMNTKDIYFVENWGRLYQRNSNIQKLIEWQNYLLNNLENKRVNIHLNNLIEKQKNPEVIMFDEWKKSL